MMIGVNLNVQVKEKKKATAAVVTLRSRSVSLRLALLARRPAGGSELGYSLKFNHHSSSYQLRPGARAFRVGLGPPAVMTRQQLKTQRALGADAARAGQLHWQAGGGNDTAAAAGTTSRAWITSSVATLLRLSHSIQVASAQPLHLVNFKLRIQPLEQSGGTH